MKFFLLDPRYKKIRGFTLVELLLSLSLFSLFIVLGYMSYHSLQKLLFQESQKIEEGRKAFLLMQALKKELHNLYYEPWNIEKMAFFSQKNLIGGERGDSLGFSVLSFYKNPFALNPGCYTVYYYVDWDERGKKVLYKKEYPFLVYPPYPENEGIKIPLVEVESFKVEFSYTGKTWMDEWETQLQKTLPRYIRIQLKGKDFSYSILVRPPVVWY